MSVPIYMRVALACLFLFMVYVGLVAWTKENPVVIFWLEAVYYLILVLSLSAMFVSVTGMAE